MPIDSPLFRLLPWLQKLRSQPNVWAQMPAERALTIALNACAAVTGGGVSYWINLLPELAGLQVPHRFIVYTRADETRLPSDLSSNFRIERVVFRGPSIGRALWEQLSLPRLLRRDRADVLLAPGDIAPLWSPCPVVLAIRNANPYWGPRASTVAGRLRERVLRVVTDLSAQRARHVFFVSQDSREKVSAALDIPLEKTSVIYHGVSPAFLDPDGLEPSRPDRTAHGIGSDDGATEPYILCVSAVRVHKDLLTLVDAFARLHSTEARCRNFRLVIAGKVVDNVFHKLLLDRARARGIAHRVQFTGELPYAALPHLYAGAVLFVYPTHAETFGHPLVEAMASGSPVVTTDLAVCREICGEAALYSDAGDPNTLSDRMRALILDEDLRSRMISEGRRRTARYSWKECAKQTVAALESAARDLG